MSYLSSRRTKTPTVAAAAVDVVVVDVLAIIVGLSAPIYDNSF